MRKPIPFVAPLLFGLVLVLSPCQSTAQPQVDPEDAPEDPARTAPWIEWALGVRGVTSFNGARFEDGSTRTAFDFSDSLLYVRPRVPLTVSRDLRGGALFALTFPDAYERPGALLVADAHMFLEHRYALLRLGRGRIKSHIIPSPALRDDDTIRIAEAQNPFSTGGSTADHQFGNMADLTIWPTPRLYGELHAENLSNAVLEPQSLTAFELNSVGLTLGYRQLPSLVTLSVVRQLGFGTNVYRLGIPGAEFAFDLLAGSWLNLIVDPVHTVDWRAQVIYAGGVPGADPSTPTGSFRARSVSAFTSIGYTYRRSLLPTFRTNVVAGYRRYLEGGAAQFTALGNFFWSLGQVVELGLQYQYRRAENGLPRIFGEDQSHSLKIVIVGTFETVVNPLFDDRASILNTESGYVP